MVVWAVVVLEILVLEILVLEVLVDLVHNLDILVVLEASLDFPVGLEVLEVRTAVDTLAFPEILPIHLDFLRVVQEVQKAF